jgi:hypothetical protein
VTSAEAYARGPPIQASHPEPRKSIGPRSRGDRCSALNTSETQLTKINSNNDDDEARYQRTRRMMQYLDLAADIAIRIGGEIIRTIIR